MARSEQEYRVALTTCGKVDVSTVLLSLDSGVFETMVFGGSLDQETKQYHTRVEAVAGHEAMVARVRSIEGC